MKLTRPQIKVGCSIVAMFLCISCKTPLAPRPGDDSTISWFAPGTRLYGASDAMLGALGRKRRIGDGEAFFERVTIPAWNSLEVYNAGTVTVTQEQIARLKELGLSAETLGAINAKLGRQTTSNFKMVQFQIRDPQRLASEIDRVLNEDGRLAGVLSESGIRIITSIWVVFDQQATSNLEAAAGATATLTKVANENVELKVDTEFQNNYKVKIGDGTIVAYQFARLCWSRNGSLFTLIRDVQQRDVCPGTTSEVLSAGTRALALPSQDAIQNINWSIGNTGDPDCRDQYKDLVSGCFGNGNRSCVMGFAISEAKRGNCQEAFRLTLITQCHNDGANSSIASAGELAVCNYLKTK